MSAVVLTGLLTCDDEKEVRTIERLLPQHLEMTLQEPGCEYFSVEHTHNPMVWKVRERFINRSAFDTHQARVQDSEWGTATANIARAYAIREGEEHWAVVPKILGKEATAALLGEYAFPGPLRDNLVAAILNGRKTATSSLFEEHNRFGEPLPKVGDLEIVINSEADPVCITRNTQVSVVPFGHVSDAHARAEGEGFNCATDWREAHLDFWTSSEYVEDMGEPALKITDESLIVLVSLHVIAVLA